MAPGRRDRRPRADHGRASCRPSCADRQRARRADRVVASIFVNPIQFGPNEDFARYPRDEAGDAAARGRRPATALRRPTPPRCTRRFSTTVSAGPLAEPLDGRFRPGHFAGVATVVAKAAAASASEIACFGEKDYQQLPVIRRVAHDLDIDCAIDGVPIVRESDGLALSFAQRLSLARRAPDRAGASSHAQRDGRAIRRRRAAHAITDEGTAKLLQTGFAKVDYVELVDAATLQPPVSRRDRPGRVLAAAWLGKTRLIDNLALYQRGSP